MTCPGACPGLAWVPWDRPYEGAHPELVSRGRDGTMYNDEQTRQVNGEGGIPWRESKE